MFCQRNLVAAGHDVIESVSGADGVELALRHRPGLLLLDYCLPDMHATEVLARLVAAWPALTTEARVLGTSAYHSARLRQSLLAAGCHQVLFKPFGTEALIAAAGHSAATAASPASVEMRLAFLHELPQQLGELDRLFCTGQWPGVSRLLHRLAGAAAFAGFRQLAASGHTLLRRCSSQPEDGVLLAESYLDFLHEAEKSSAHTSTD